MTVRLRDHPGIVEQTGQRYLKIARDKTRR